MLRLAQVGVRNQVRPLMARRGPALSAPLARKLHTELDPPNSDPVKLEFMDVQELNFKGPKIDNPVGVFLGSTHGIGEYSAYAFAKYAKNPTIYIVGRDKEAGDKVIRRLKGVNGNSDAQYHFIPRDLTRLKQVEEVCNAVKENESKINSLTMTCGFLNIKGREETQEGLDRKMAILYYSRWLAVKLLVPLLEKAASLGEPARVTSVLGAGIEESIDETNLDVKHDYKVSDIYNTLAEYNSLSVMKYAKEHPSVSFTHIFPKLTSTNIHEELPWYLVPFTELLLFFKSRPTDTGERIHNVQFVNPAFDKGPHILGKDFENLIPTLEHRKLLEQHLQDNLWQHTNQVFKDIVGK